MYVRSFAHVEHDRHTQQVRIAVLAFDAVIILPSWVMGTCLAMLYPTPGTRYLLQY